MFTLGCKLSEMWCLHVLTQNQVIWVRTESFLHVNTVINVDINTYTHTRTHCTCIQSWAVQMATWHLSRSLCNAKSHVILKNALLPNWFHSARTPPGDWQSKFHFFSPQEGPTNFVLKPRISRRGGFSWDYTSFICDSRCYVIVDGV